MYIFELQLEFIRYMSVYIIRYISVIQVEKQKTMPHPYAIVN